jgi:hypothetical protein
MEKVNSLPVCSMIIWLEIQKYMKDTDFKYRSSNGFLNLNTSSPSGNFFYRVKTPKELNKSAFGCEIAFFDIEKKLIYRRSRVFAHELHGKAVIDFERRQMELHTITTTDKSTIQVVSWSKQENFVYFLEHKSGNYKKFYESVFLNLKDQNCYRIDELKDNFKIVDSLNLNDRQFDENEILKTLQNLKLNTEVLFKDKVKHSFLNKTKWYPEI